MVDRVDVNSVLMQMRQVKDQLRSQASPQINGATLGPTSNDRANAASGFQQQLSRQMQAASPDYSVSLGSSYSEQSAASSAPNYNSQSSMRAYNLVQDGLARSASDSQEALPLEVGRPGAIESDFQSMIQRGIDQVNENQKIAGDLARRFEQGEQGIDLPEVMIAMQKSSVSFQAMTQVRNKLVEAYKDVMNMPV